MAESLQLAAESLCAFGGFGAAAINVVRDDRVVTIAVAGADRVLDESGTSIDVGLVLGRSSPAALLRDDILPYADRWGLLYHLPHDRNDVGHFGWRVDRQYDDTEWHPDDLLLAPVHDGNGRMCGLISLDGPTEGRLPAPEQRPLLDRYVAQAARILVTAIEREQLAERLRLLDVAREALRQAAGTSSPEEAFAEATPSLVAGFGLAGLRASVFAAPTETGSAESEDDLLGSLARLDRESAEELWRTQSVAVVGRSQVVDEHGTPEERLLVQRHLDRTGLESVLFVPMGAGQTCLGSLVFSRAAGAPAWSSEERRVAQDIGRDLGRLIADSDALRREQRLVRELRELDTYKRDLMAAISHELKTPIASILSNAELIGGMVGSTDDEDDVRRGAAAMERGARRMSDLVNELLLLARLDEPGRSPATSRIDVTPSVVSGVQQAVESAGRPATQVTTDLPEGPVVVSADPHGIEQVVVNLVGNAVKYTPPGRRVTVSLRRGTENVELAVTDEGIGISPDDQRLIFTEFFRSSDPAARRQPGTGLGLAIVERIVAHHGGRVEVESAAGCGSTFRVILPVG
jgi:signal transduction histidine kinase